MYRATRNVLTWTIISLLALHCSIAAAYPDLRDSIDLAFTEQVEKELRKEFPDARGELTRAGKMSLVVVDVSAIDSPQVAEINGDLMLYAASLPKIAILYAAFVEIDRGALTLDEVLLEDLTRMVRVSSNEAASKVYQRIGPQRIAEILESEPHQLYDPERGGGLWVGRGYGGGDAWKRDPVNGISHGASAMQAARLYYLLLTGRLVSESSTEQMMAILDEPGVDHKFVKGLEDENPDANIMRKSGTWRTFHADSAIVIDPNYSYIVVALFDFERGQEALERLIGAIDDAVQKRQTPDAGSGYARAVRAS